MEVRAELDSYQRELLMRLYRSRLNEEVFPVSFDMRGVGEGLIACGFIVATNGFYEFTESGLKVWKAYGAALHSSYERNYRKSIERRKQKKMAEKKQAELSDWEKQARENLTPKKIDALQALYEAGADTVWVEADIHHATRDALVRYGFIEWDSKTNKYWLLDAGVQKLAEYPSSNNGARPKPEELSRRPLNLEGRVRVKPFVEDEHPTPAINPTPTLPEFGEGVDALEHCDTCAGCVDHEVLHMLAAKYPAIARLRQTVLETRRLMDELGIEKK